MSFVVIPVLCVAMFLIYVCLAEWFKGPPTFTDDDD
jgi:hypothetical protein